MNEMQLHTIPWSHVLLDNFLNGDTLEDVLEWWETVPKNSRWEGTVFRQAFDKEGNFIDLWFTQSFIKKLTDVMEPELVKTIYNEISFKVRSVGTLLEAELDDEDAFVIDFQYINKNTAYPFHIDASDKLLTLITFIHPEKNLGTLVGNSKNAYETGYKYTEWKPNRALVFKPDDTTWHAFRSDGRNRRMTLNINIYKKIDNPTGRIEE